MQHEKGRRLVVGEISWRYGAFTNDSALGQNQSDSAGFGGIR